VAALRCAVLRSVVSVSRLSKLSTGDVMLRSGALEQSAWCPLSDVALRVVGALRPLRPVESAPASEKSTQQERLDKS
jgi:hypothetical protein